MSSSHPNTLTCGINVDNQALKNSAMAGVFKNPAASLKALSNGNPDSVLFEAVVDSSRTMPRLWRSGAPALYVRYIVDGYKCQAELDGPTWKQPLVGITNTLVGISNEKSQDRDSAILANLRESYPRIVAVIMRDLGQLVPPGLKADVLKAIVCQYMLEMISTASHQRNMYDKGTLALMMHCWINVSMDRQHRKPVTDLVRCIFTNLPEGIQTDIMDEAIDAVTIEAFDARIRQVLEDPCMIDETIIEESFALIPLLVADRPWRLAFTPTRVYKYLVEALQRQVQNGSPEHTPEAMHAGYRFLHALTHGRLTPWVSIMEDFLTNTPYLEVTAEGLIIAEQNNSDDWIKMLDQLCHSARCKCPYHITPLILISFQTKLEHLYIPTRDKLCHIGGPDSPRLQIWDRFADSVGISESLLLAKWMREVKCCNPYCTSRTSKKKGGDLMKCVGCQSVYYHGKPCQKADWKRHKPQCKRPVPKLPTIYSD